MNLYNQLKEEHRITLAKETKYPVLTESTIKALLSNSHAGLLTVNEALTLFDLLGLGVFNYIKLTELFKKCNWKN